TRHGGAMNAVAPGFSPDVNDGICFARGARVEDLVAPHQAQGKGIHQRITGIAGFKLRLAAEVRNPKAVSIRRNPADNPFEDGVVLVNLSWRALLGWADEGVGPYVLRDWTEAQRIHHRNRPCTHGEDVAQDAAHASSRAL